MLITPKQFIKLLTARRAGIEDPHRIGLVIEGGGVRGIASCAPLIVLEELGLRGAFDRVYGTSAGAINGAYFLAGQSRLAASIYFEDLTGKNFVSFRRWPEVMNLKFLFTDCIEGTKPLDAQALAVALAVERSQFYISATELESGREHFFVANKMPHELIIRMLRASASAPLFTRNFETIEGKRYNDGQVRAAIPIQRALADGCTHVLCLLTQKSGYQKSLSLIERALELAQLRHHSQAYRQAFKARVPNYNENLAAIYAPNQPAQVAVFAPDKHDWLTSSSERVGEKILKCGQAALERTLSTLGLPGHLTRPLDPT